MSDEKDFYYSDVNEQKEAIAHLLECTQWWPSTREHKVLKGLLAERERLRAELADAIKQRDEAQREVCEMIARTRRKAGIRGSTVGLDRVAPEAIAAERGWDCYAQEGGGA